MSETRKDYEAPRAEAKTEPWIEDRGPEVVQRLDALTHRQSDVVRELHLELDHRVAFVVPGAVR